VYELRKTSIADKDSLDEGQNKYSKVSLMICLD